MYTRYWCRQHTGISVEHENLCDDHPIVLAGHLGQEQYFILIQTNLTSEEEQMRRKCLFFPTHIPRNSTYTVISSRKQNHPGEPCTSKLRRTVFADIMANRAAGRFDATHVNCAYYGIIDASAQALRPFSDAVFLTAIAYNVRNKRLYLGVSGRPSGVSRQIYTDWDCDQCVRVRLWCIILRKYIYLRCVFPFNHLLGAIQQRPLVVLS